MEQFKRAQIIMLSTKNKSIITLVGNKLVKINESNYGFSHIKSQHLYIISDDTFVKKGEWYYDTFSKTIKQCNSLSYQSNVVRKIIATTDTSIIYRKGFAHNPIDGFADVPQPSQQFIQKFIEEYNRGNIITDVLIEYEKATYDKWFNNGGQPVFDTIKINPKDNTITIKKVKDSYTREEVIKLIKRFNSESAGNAWFDTDEKWIEENL